VHGSSEFSCDDEAGKRRASLWATKGSVDRAAMRSRSSWKIEESNFSDVSPVQSREGA
jgi:hypothetical protein